MNVNIRQYNRGFYLKLRRSNLWFFFNNFFHSSIITLPYPISLINFLTGFFHLTADELAILYRRRERIILLSVHNLHVLNTLQASSSVNSRICRENFTRQWRIIETVNMEVDNLEQSFSIWFQRQQTFRGHSVRVTWVESVLLTKIRC